MANTTAAGEAELSTNANASLALINALATAARARTNPGATSVPASSLETAAAASATIPQDPVGLAIQAIKDIAAPASSDAGLIDRLTIYLAKAATATLHNAQAPAPSAGTAVARVVGFLGPQAGGAAAAASAHPSPAATSSASPAPGDDAEIKEDDDIDSAKPK